MASGCQQGDRQAAVRWPRGAEASGKAGNLRRFDPQGLGRIACQLARELPASVYHVLKPRAAHWRTGESRV